MSRKCDCFGNLEDDLQPLEPSPVGNLIPYKSLNCPKCGWIDTPLVSYWKDLKLCAEDHPLLEAFLKGTIKSEEHLHAICRGCGYLEVRPCLGQ